MTFEDVNNIWDFMGGVRWTSRSKKTSVAYSVDTGPQDPDGRQQRFASSLVFKHQFTEQFQYVLQNDLGQQKNTPAPAKAPSGTTSTSTSSTSSTSCWSANLRAEWFRDANGVRVAGRRPTPDCVSGRWAASPATSTR